MTKNKYKVPKKQWAKWDEGARAVFNIVYSESKFQDVIATGDPISMERWNIIRWNIAWLSADKMNKTWRVATWINSKH